MRPQSYVSHPSMLTSNCPNWLCCQRVPTTGTHTPLSTELKLMALTRLNLVRKITLQMNGYCCKQVMSALPECGS